MSNAESRGSLAARPPETDVAATLAWFVDREKALQREGKYDAAAQAALEAELETYGEKTRAAMEQAQPEADARFASARRQSQASSEQGKPRNTMARIGLGLAIAFLALVAGIAYLTQH
jgi:hypothetical protein